MKRLDLIIDALDVSESLFYEQAKLQEALQAARSLRELEPVAWVYKDNTVTTDPDRADGTWTKLYDLGDEK